MLRECSAILGDKREVFSGTGRYVCFEQITLPVPVSPIIRVDDDVRAALWPDLLFGLAHHSACKKQCP